MSEILNTDLEKYDRQIRLFGIETQKKIQETPLVIVQTNKTKKHSLIGGEILKNILLLGFNIIYCDEEILSSFNELCPNPHNELNKNVKLTMISKEDVYEERFDSYIFVLVDTLVNIIGNNKFFLCSACFSYHNTLISHSVCNRNIDELTAIKECMLGAFFVNDLINFIKDGKEIEGFLFPEL
ncbi:hypothetical protein H311_02496 [Anncaliia algerae PRA109]|nr:hypothetical protein H311_02496 [Anncaliia algerae PRA109]